MVQRHPASQQFTSMEERVPWEGGEPCMSIPKLSKSLGVQTWGAGEKAGGSG